MLKVFFVAVVVFVPGSFLKLILTLETITQ